MNIFLDKIDDITIEHIDKFIAEKHPENIRLEYKSGFSTTNANQQIAKEVSAFANQYGGVLIYGISEESGKTRKPDAIVGIDKVSNPRQKIQSVCLEHIHTPIVPEIQECELEDDNSKVVAIVRINMSDEAPHTINEKTGFYIRIQDRSEPREMTSDEIELLWNRRARIAEIREWLLQRTYERVFPAGAFRKHMVTASIMRAIPLFPLHPLIERSSLLDQYALSKVPARNDFFPISEYNINTASDSIYTCWFEKDAVTPREAYGEVNVFGQVSYFEDYITHHNDGNVQIEGIVLTLELRNLLLMVNFLGKWYKNLGFWGIVKFIWNVENCKDAQVYYYNYQYNTPEKLTRIKLDNNLKIERQLLVSEIIERPEAIVESIFQEYLWDCGLKNQQINSLPVSDWIKRATQKP
jgi:hypothetical protein